MQDIIFSFKNYLILHKKSVRTIDAYVKNLHKFMIFLNEQGIEVAAISTEVIYDFLRHLLQEGVGTQLYIQVIGSLKKLQEFLQTQQPMFIDWSSIRQRIPFVPSFPLAATEQYIMEVWSNLDTSFEGSRLSVLIGLLYAYKVPLNVIPQVLWPTAPIAAVICGNKTIMIEEKHAEIFLRYRKLLSELYEAEVSGTYVFSTKQGTHYKAVKTQVIWSLLQQAFYKKKTSDLVTKKHKLMQEDQYHSIHPRGNAV